ncbi:hypothetical protein SDC9_188252 [bioreactor metagenome]|uniref:HipA-like kinase domain-containing protein n=1 Tax=bioreactor metagenome TaxID=1076179 RepID=A0A645HZL0_9ZZZZ
MLISELLGRKIASALGLQIPELVFATLDEDFGRSEGDEEIQDLLKSSEGLNLGLHYLSGAIAYDPTVKIDSFLASKIVWLDAYTTNIDRTFNNTNLLWWHRELWVIDNGASFYFHHSWNDFERHALNPFPHIKDHVLLPQASMLDEADQLAHEVLSSDLLEEITELIPDEWLEWNHTQQVPDEIRRVYLNLLKTRLRYSQNFLKTAKDARG